MRKAVLSDPEALRLQGKERAAAFTVRRNVIAGKAERILRPFVNMKPLREEAYPKNGWRPKVVNHRVSVILKLFDRTCLLPGRADANRAKGEVSPEDIRNLGVLCANRLARVAAMMELFLARGWSCRGHRRSIIMEGNDLEAYQVKEMLREHGYGPSEYEIRLDYTRKWGIM